MYSEQNKHCRECLCTTCDLFQLDGCLEGADCCDKCDNTSHTAYCPWHPEENSQIDYL